ncbi:MAG: flagellar basal body rod protein FlgC [Candidatus Eremiobacteraeota bacterium]|nr:flagellar basal body rod protein FlgC [Candidatus Eremiobacteraeota bacterium]MBV8280508.1 flagellar basal body rod protein FlgC [Candidatus Eremiobacteraeota bacterium]
MIDDSSAFDIAASGMAAQRLTMDVIAQNLANADVQRADGSIYHALRPSFEPASSDSGFAIASDFEIDPAFDDEATPAGVRFAGLVEAQSAPAYRLDPENPLAATSGPHKGYVEVADVDPIAQMVGMVAAGRAYDADLSALQTAKQMDTEAIDIEQL